MAEIENAWAAQKMAAGGGAKKGYIGFGQHIVSQIIGSGKYTNDLLKESARPRWKEVFSDLFEEISWYGIAASRSFT